jgi:large subunit ribosomal protein L27Ae
VILCGHHGHGDIQEKKDDIGGRKCRVHANQNWRNTWRQEANSDAQLWSLVPLELRDSYVAGKKPDTVPVIDLLPLGYSKVLGKGRLPEIPIVVKARWVSRLAEKKITEAGGVVELVA